VSERKGKKSQVKKPDEAELKTPNCLANMEGIILNESLIDLT